VNAPARPSIVCLLPVRNGAEHLPEYLDAAPAWCDAIVALDDGSTDDTRQLLAASPLVHVLLSNEPRQTYGGWNDGENRNRLLEASAPLRPEWIVSVDVDERIPSDDAAALRRFLAADALPGIACGLRHLRMWGDDEYDPESLWVYRCFAWREGLAFPDRELHFNPVPTSIPRNGWVRTSIRLQHLAAQTEERRLARLEKYHQADPDSVYRTNFGGLDERPRRLARFEAREPDEPILLPVDHQFGLAALIEEQRDGHPVDETPAAHRVVCLLPARNCEHDLPGYFASVARVADAVVALDDGSTDGTGAFLEAEPLVKVLLTRPERPDHREWDDAGNRRALLEAAAALRPAWILSLDADERLDPGDAEALRAFCAEDGGALPGFAYGFRVHRMIDDLDHFDRADLWVYRLFAWREDLHLPVKRLHFVPVPEEIPRERYLNTTLRIQHLSGLTEARRRARFEKYREADEDLDYQGDYSELLVPPGELQRWEPRPPGLPVLVLAEAGAPGSSANLEDDFEFDPDRPVLSAVVISRDDEDRIERAVRSVVSQEVPEPFEVIVVVSGTDRTAEIVRDRFPEVTLVELDRPALPGEARNAGVAVARGDYVSFPGSHIVLPPGSLAARIEAHELGWPMVTGSFLNANPTRAGWASYFLDHAGSLPGRPSGELTFAPAHCSYDREVLLRTGGFPEDMRAGEDTVVNTELFRRGYRAYRSSEVTLYHESPCRTPWRLARHHFTRGRALGRIMLENVSRGKRILSRPVVRRLLVGYVPRRVSSVKRNVGAHGDARLRRAAGEVRGLILLGAAAAWAGTWFELLRPAPGSFEKLVGRPAWNVALAGLDRREGFIVGRTDVLLLARVEPLAGRVRLLTLPRDLYVRIPGFGQGRLNEAYFRGANHPGGEDPRGGMRLMERTVHGALGMRVHGTVLVDFAGFAAMIDALGGVEVTVPARIDDEFVGEDGDVFAAHFAAGRQRLDGAQALTYARTRKADGDRFRRERHADLIGAMLQGLTGVRSPSGALDVLRAAAAAIRTDLGPVRTVAIGQALIRARRSGRIEPIHVVPPIVRSERIERGWVHLDLGGLRAFVRDRFVIGDGDAGMPAAERTAEARR
jgi:LCP family protein required for cell wall assembly